LKKPQKKKHPGTLERRGKKRWGEDGAGSMLTRKSPQGREKKKPKRGKGDGKITRKKDRESNSTLV